MPEVLTHKGFRKYEGVRISENSKRKITIQVDGEKTTCTEDHQILLSDGSFKYAKDIDINDVLHSKNQIQNITTKKETCMVYDLINVNETHSYQTNNIISHNCIYLDEFAFVDNADDFFTSTYPVISSGANTKVIITSTPHGMNLFHKIWKEAERGRNKFQPIEVHWSEHPRRDEEWKSETIANIGEKQFDQEYGCVAEDTLITIRNKNTKIIEKISIGDLYKKL